MPQYRQSGTERYGALHHHHHNSNGAPFNDHMTVGIRAAQYNKPARARRTARSDKASRRLSIGSVIFVLLLVLLVTVLASYYISGYGIHNDDYQDKELISHSAVDDELKNDLDFLTNVTRTDTFKVIGFGKGSIVHGRDSRYWDKDDRGRDDDYSKDVVEHTKDESTNAGHVSVKVDSGSKKISFNSPHKGSNRKGVGLYNEAGRNELKMYEAEYEASLKGAGRSGNNVHVDEASLKGAGRSGNNENQQSSDKVFGVDSEPIDVDDDYNNNVQFHATQVEEYDDSGQDKGDHSDGAKIQNQYRRESSDFNDVRKQHQNVAKEVKESSLKSQNSDKFDANQRQVSLVGDQSTKASPKKKVRRHKFSRSCEMKFLNSTTQLVEPLESRKFARFFLQYTEVEEKPDGEALWEPRFAGHQNLHEREESFLAHDQKINCGFVKAAEGYPNTGFDLAEDDANYISRCHIAVISCIFGNSDRLRIPADKMITRLSKKNVCFVMFMDELTSQTLSSEGRIPDRTGFIGLWKIVVVKDLPYDDMRRVGKIPKLLPHRLFPSARYSIWLDSKLRLQRDPLLILEYFLWRKGYEYAISNHYDRHCVWEEVAQNKKLNKYNQTVIDQQFAFYQSDGLKRFDPSDPERLLPSNVPEGSFIVRAHTPMSNLFSCLWFNEVDRFTSRDQLSFAYTYQKLRRMNPDKMFYLNMFKDCERRSVAKLFRHRSVEKRDVRQQAAT